jgi:hypothetical protein
MQVVARLLMLYFSVVQSFLGSFDTSWLQA